ncbi:hypothetical protein WJX81_004052 [Elliptochloris bilobata]|uniref:Rhodanese domain-containing protein n=1 Tax=Elliptochloris bilobata TaxID=381761 RepID=A0AAW1SBH0_9CHLO
MPVITNVGGSITSAVALTLLAWAVRFIRSRAERQRKRQLQRRVTDRSSGKYSCGLSPAALRMLVETNPVPHYVVDVRAAKAAEQAPLPGDLQTALRLPAGEVGSVLASRGAAWPARFPDSPAPARDWLLVFLADAEQEARGAAAEAAAAGFERGLFLEGGLPAYGHAAHAQADLRYIGRDALAVLLGLAGDGAPRCEAACVLDVRRSDERALYGSIPGTVHVPADQLPAALQLAPGEWEAAYRCAKPTQDTWLVLHGRTGQRAAWAAQIAIDAGYARALVFRPGVYGWRAHPAVRAYRAYKRGEAPPEPEAVLTEPITAAGEPRRQAAIVIACDRPLGALLAKGGERRGARGAPDSPGDAMGKSRRRHKHPNTGYPYTIVRVAQIHVVRPKARHPAENGVYIGLLLEATVEPIFPNLPREPLRRRSGLKRLDFVRTCGEFWGAKAASVYRGTRAFVPNALDSSLRAVEDRVAGLGMPLLMRSEDVLRSVDITVDSALTVVRGLLAGKSLGDALVATRQHSASEYQFQFVKARNDYLQQVEDAIAFLKETGITGAARAAVTTLLGSVREAHKTPPALEFRSEAVISKVSDAWGKLVVQPPVTKLVETVQPTVDFSYHKYCQAHDVVVASEAYNRALETASAIIHKVTGSLVYRVAASKLYPVISPYADPALAKVTHSALYASVVDHLKPMPTQPGSPEGKHYQFLSCAQC